MSCLERHRFIFCFISWIKKYRVCSFGAERVFLYDRPVIIVCLCCLASWRCGLIALAVMLFIAVLTRHGIFVVEKGFECGIVRPWKELRDCQSQCGLSTSLGGFGKNHLKSRSYFLCC